MDFTRDFYWHDSTLLKIDIDRTPSRKNEIIRITIDWYDTGISTMTFDDVRWANLDMNFGYIGNETIATAQELGENDLDLQHLYTSWKGYLDKFKFNVYKIETTSGSTIKIIAKGFIVKEHKGIMQLYRKYIRQRLR
jgi:hypothetical protein